MPKLIYNIEDKKRISEILEQFYLNPPSNYGLSYTDKSAYESYLRLISIYVRPEARILDVGSRTWHLPACIAKNGYECFGCDFFSKEDLAKYDSMKNNSNFHLIFGSGYSLPFESKSFDAVATMNVMEHVVFVDKFLKEMDRVLKPGGTLIINCPNWAGLNVPVRALASLIFAKKRYWQYEKIDDAALGILRSFIWYLKVLFSKKEQYILAYPRLKDNKIDFNESDDDCAHLCQPLSFKKWLKNHNYRILKYNRAFGNSLIAKMFNFLFPSFATINVIVGQKPLYLIGENAKTAVEGL